MIMQCTLAEFPLCHGLHDHLQFSCVPNGIADDLSLISLLCLLEIFLSWEVYPAVFQTPALIFSKVHHGSLAVLEEQVLSGCNRE
jgi:hypothetical protein